MKATLTFLLAAVGAALAPLAAAQPPAPTARELARVERILARTPLIDGHNDLPDTLREHYASDLARVDLRADARGFAPHPLHTDIPRLRAGHVGGQFWSLYVPYELDDLAATQAVWRQIDLTRRMVARYPDVFELARSADDIVRIHRAGRIASMFGIEGGEAINNDLALLREFREAGVLYMTLTHNRNTDWVDSAAVAPEHGGLAPFGEEVVREMNRIGMLVDLSHVSAEAMRDALLVSTAPVIFSHSSAFALTAHPRNVPDDVLALVRENGGVVMVNFFPMFTSTAVWNWEAAHAGEEARLASLHRGAPDAAAAALAAWERANPRPEIELSVIADHIEHIARVAGRDHVGLGSDFDGVPYLPRGLDGVDSCPRLLVELMRRGWSDADLAKLAGGNLLRVLRRAEAVAG